MTTRDFEAHERPTRALLWVSLLQGACLYFLYGSAEAQRWPATDPIWFFLLTTLVIVAPLMLLLSATRENWRGVTRDTVIASAVLALLAVYVGSQAEPFPKLSLGNLIGVYVITTAIAAFKLVVYIQCRADGLWGSYPSLFTNSWRSFLIGVLGSIFAVFFYLILMLWAALFDIIGIDFFDDLFSEAWFLIPSVTFAFGVGALLFRRHTRIIDSITSLLHSLIKLLLPLAVMVSVVFLSALPFTGLAPLWETGSGTALLLWLLALMLFFTNAVYQDGREAVPYPVFLHRAIYIGICTGLILSVLAFYGLFLRLQDYGWTVERCWAFVTWLLLTLYALGYVVGVIRRRDAWTEDLARTNTVVGLVLLVIMLLTNSPLLDFRKSSLASQIARVESGEIELRDFDFYYMKHHLARPGYLYGERLKAQIGDSDPDLIAEIDNPQFRTGNEAPPRVLWTHVRSRPEGLTIPPELRDFISDSAVYRLDGPSVLLAVDLDEDGADEYVLIQIWSEGWGVATANLFFQTSGGWNSVALSVEEDRWLEDLHNTLLTGEVEIKTQRFKDLDIGGVRFSVGPTLWLE
ncbi:MAG: DUF4153 domain-containing protein [Pseudomonadota bacterium]